MPNQKWFPSRIGDQAAWLRNFAARVGAYETLLGLVGAEVDAVVAGCLYAAFVVGDYHPYVQAFAEEVTKFRDMLLSGSGPSALPLPVFSPPALPTGVVPVPPGVVNERLFAIVAKIKAATGYTEVIGTDLGIVATSPHPAPGPIFPKFSAAAEQGTSGQQVRLDFVKHGHAGVSIECLRHNATWESLGTHTVSPFIDTRALLVAGTPEARQYRARYVDKDLPIGEFCPIVTVTVGV